MTQKSVIYGNQAHANAAINTADGGHFTSASFFRKNKDSKYEKPCEDFHIADQENGIFILMDGATRYVKSGTAYPSLSHAAEASRIICNFAHAYLLEEDRNRSEHKSLLLNAAQNANRAVKAYNTKNFSKHDHLENDYANACGIISYIHADTFYFAYLGDPQGYLIRNGQIKLFTTTQTAMIDQLYNQFAQVSTASVEDFRKSVCLEIRNNISHQYKFGSFTGEDSATDLLEFGEIKLQAGDRIILTSDGLLQVFSHKPELFTGDDYSLIFDEMERIEPLFNIRSDDKTLISIEKLI